MKVTKVVGWLLISLKIAAFGIVLSKQVCPFFIRLRPAPDSCAVPPVHLGMGRVCSSPAMAKPLE